MNWNEIFTNAYMTKMLSTVILILIAVVARSLIVRNILNKRDVDATTRRQWIVSTRNTTFLIIFAIVTVIWLEQLRNIAAAIVVIAAAIVVATKEFILNILGFVYQGRAKFISIGDRIEIEGIRGDVIDQSLLGTTLLEIGSGEKSNQYTGLTIHVPNAKYLSATIKNETHLWGDYVFHLITIPIEKEQQWEVAEQSLLKAAEKICAPYLDEAKKSMNSLARRHSLDNPTVEPRINLQVIGPEKINLILRVPVPTKRRGRIEQEIIRLYLQILKQNVNIAATEQARSQK